MQVENNIHPMSGSGSGGKIFDFLKMNPFAAFLGAMLLLAVIVPPRKRKYKPKKKARRRKKSKKIQRLNPVRKYPGKKKKAKKPAPVASHRTATRTRTKTTKTGVPPWRVKGSKEASDYMRKLRLKRKK
jgi:protein subunit release factor B